MQNRMLIRGALLLAIALMAQQLRLVIPLPPLAMTLVIGTMVNCSLVLAAKYAPLSIGVAMCLALPVVAFLQGHLPLPFLIPVVFLGNAVFVGLCHHWWNKAMRVIAPIVKAFTMYVTALFMLAEFLPSTVAAQAILFGMGWPQLITAFLGIILAEQLEKRTSLS